MINQIHIKNFKSLKDVKLSLSNLNVLTGLNSAGKSSLVQALLLLKQSSNIKEGRLEINGSPHGANNFFQLGKGKDILYQYTEQYPAFIEILLASTDINLEWKFAYNANSDDLRSENTNYGYADLQKVNLFTDNVQYLNAERLGPHTTYGSSSLYTEHKQQLGNHGEYAVHYLNSFGSSYRIKHEKLLHPKRQSPNLKHQVEAWLGEISPGTKLNTTAVPNTELIILDFQFETKRELTNRFRPINVGFGISYVLPVVLALLMAQENRLIIIENPEAHLHPRGQAEMGKLIALAAAAGAQIIIETHSDHLLNGIRVATKKSAIQDDKVKVFFFERIDLEDEQYTTAHPIKIDKNGEFNQYPKGFLDEWSNQLLNLI